MSAFASIATRFNLLHDWVERWRMGRAPKRDSTRTKRRPFNGNGRAQHRQEQDVLCPATPVAQAQVYTRTSKTRVCVCVRACALPPSNNQQVSSKYLAATHGRGRAQHRQQRAALRLPPPVYQEPEGLREQQSAKCKVQRGTRKRGQNQNQNTKLPVGGEHWQSRRGRQAAAPCPVSADRAMLPLCRWLSSLGKPAPPPECGPDSV
jgi:hypothetical protein